MSDELHALYRDAAIKRWVKTYEKEFPDATTRELIDASIALEEQGVRRGSFQDRAKAAALLIRANERHGTGSDQSRG